MRIQGEQKYVLLAGMTGFLLGICSANLWMKQYVLDIGILNQYFRKQRDRTHRYRTRTTGNLLCNGRDRVIPLYAGISNGEMGCGKKYPAWPVPDAGDHYRVLCKSGTYRLVFEDTVNIQKCRIKEPIHGKICFISCIGSFLCGKSVNICRRIQITGKCSKETGISG